MQRIRVLSRSRFDSCPRGLNRTLTRSCEFLSLPLSRSRRWRRTFPLVFLLGLNSTRSPTSVPTISCSLFSHNKMELFSRYPCKICNMKECKQKKNDHKWMGFARTIVILEIERVVKPKIMLYSKKWHVNAIKPQPVSVNNQHAAVLQLSLNSVWSFQLILEILYRMLNSPYNDVGQLECWKLCSC